MLRNYALLVLVLLVTGASADHSAYNESESWELKCRALHAEPASTWLNGAHLRFGEVAWAPYGIKNESAPKGWSGFDIALADLLAERLGFTYEVIELTREIACRSESCYVGEDAPTKETWDEVLMRGVNETDLILSWWSQSQSRRDFLGLLLGHIDDSAMMVVRTILAPTWWESVHLHAGSFLQPFEPTLWLAIIAMLLLGAVCDYLLERGDGGSIAASLYESFAGAIFGGYNTPRTRLSALYQIFVAVVVLVLVSAYTANLAAFILAEGAERLSVSSMAELLETEQPACIRATDPVVATYKYLFPRLITSPTTYANQRELAAALLDGSCPAILAPRSYVVNWARDPEYCALRPRDMLLPAVAGWVTGKHNICIQRPIEAALQALLLSGLLI